MKVNNRENYSTTVSENDDVEYDTIEFEFVQDKIRKTEMKKTLGISKEDYYKGLKYLLENNYEFRVNFKNKKLLTKWYVDSTTTIAFARHFCPGWKYKFNQKKRHSKSSSPSSPPSSSPSSSPPDGKQ